MLHDRIVCGISNAQIQKRLLAEKTLTFTEALEVALGLEAELRMLKSQVRSQEVLSTSGKQEMYAMMPPASSWYKEVQPRIL